MNVLRHSGFHKVVRGERYNPACLACKYEEEKASVGIVTCPLGRPKWQRNCVACPYYEEGGCNYLTEAQLKALAEDGDKTQAIWFTYLWQLLHIDMFLRLSEDGRRRAISNEQDKD